MVIRGEKGTVDGDQEDKPFFPRTMHRGRQLLRQNRAQVPFDQDPEDGPRLIGARTERRPEGDDVASSCGRRPTWPGRGHPVG